jgi:putative zinc finger/helix-turn-helix YgiT family protein
MKTCAQCRKLMKTERQNYRYTESGLANVTLVGIEVSHCPSCGERVVSIPRMAQLHRAIALELIRKSAKLTSAEIRFLRKQLGLSSKDLAARIGVEPETVSRWESDANPQPISPPAERALRLMVAVGERVAEYPVDRLAEIKDEPEVIPMRMNPEPKWHAEAAWGRSRRGGCDSLVGSGRP